MNNDILKRRIRDFIFIGATSIILSWGISILMEELNLPGGDWRGLATIWLLVVVILPISILVFIPWNIWFLIQYIKYRNKAFENNIKPFWMTVLVFTYMIIHYVIVFWQEF